MGVGISRNAGSGDPAYNNPPAPVGRVPSPGVGACPRDMDVGISRNAGSGDPAYKAPSPGGAKPDDPPPRRLRRLHRVWPDRDGNLAYLLTLCVEGRGRVLANEATFQRLAAFLLDSPARYRWFPRRFVVMPDHLHLIAHQGLEAVRLGQWIKALKAVVGGLKRRPEAARRVGEPGLPEDGVLGCPGAEHPERTPGRQPDVPVGRVPHKR